MYKGEWLAFERSISKIKDTLHNEKVCADSEDIKLLCDKISTSIDDIMNKYYELEVLENGM